MAVVYGARGVGGGRGGQLLQAGLVFWGQAPDGGHPAVGGVGAATRGLQRVQVGRGDGEGGGSLPG